MRGRIVIIHSLLQVIIIPFVCLITDITCHRSALSLRDCVSLLWLLLSTEIAKGVAILTPLIIRIEQDDDCHEDRSLQIRMH